MRRITATTTIILLITTTLMAFSAKSNMSINKKPKKIVNIVYHFQDSSVPPEYHRSYTITAYQDSIHIIVDSYGTVLNEKTYPLSSEKFDSLISAIDEYKIRNCRETHDKGCTGGTSRSIIVYGETETITEGTMSMCGGKIYGNLSGNMDEFSKLIKSFIPDISKVIRPD
ncbi:MAG: hypothetical protein ABIJ97_01550 [Bacteroidota bacterium]